MTLFSASHATKVLALAVALTAGGMTVAAARDRSPDVGWSDNSDADWSKSSFIGRSIERRGHRDWRPRDRHRDDRRVERHRDRHWHKDRNFYGGAISAYRDPGNGIYFYVDRNRYYEDRVDAPRVENRGKVIVVTPGQNGCSWEAGVCVIRRGF
ncbi:hypothetical protein AB3G45_07600 [Shinella sp. S4-D37]|uniref:hypothetical protein n=1 Tax=Shinella sp. S4-D37 TaxID=3161999 RepID=UPI0034665417